jgi:hypothetical protein
MQGHVHTAVGAVFNTANLKFVVPKLEVHKWPILVIRNELLKLSYTFRCHSTAKLSTKMPVLLIALLTGREVYHCHVICRAGNAFCPCIGWERLVLWLKSAQNIIVLSVQKWEPRTQNYSQYYLQIMYVCNYGRMIRTMRRCFRIHTYIHIYVRTYIFVNNVVRRCILWVLLSYISQSHFLVSGLGGGGGERRAIGYHPDVIFLTYPCLSRCRFSLAKFWHWIALGLAFEVCLVDNQPWRLRH